MYLPLERTNVRDRSVFQNEATKHVALEGNSPPWGRIIFSLSAITVCAKIFGFAEKIVIAHYFGTTKTADVYFAVMAIVLSITFLIKELIHPSLLPVFARTLTHSANASGGLFRTAFLAVAGALVTGGIVFVAFSPSIVKCLAPGFSPSQKNTASLLLRCLTPGVICLGLMAVTYATLNARQKFLLSALGEMAFKLLVAIGFTILLPLMGIHAMAPVIGASACLCLLFHLYCLDDSRHLFIRNHGHYDQYFKKVLVLMGPLIVGVIFSHISDVVDNLLASQLPTGQLSYLNYAKRIVDAILLIGPVAVVTVAYSQMSQLSSQNRQEQFAQMFRKALRLLLYLSIPIACILIELRQPLLQCLFQHGSFDATSTRGTSSALLLYAVGLVTFSLDALFVYSFYAMSDTKTPVTYGVLCVLINIALAIALSAHFEYVGIAAALVAAKTIKVIMLGHRLRRRIKGVFDARIAVFLLKLAIATILLWITVKGLSVTAVAGSFLQITLMSLIAPALAGIAVFLVSSYLLGLDESKVLVSIVLRKRNPLRF